MNMIQRFSKSEVISDVSIHNKVIYISGQFPTSGDPDISVQTWQVLEKIDKILEEHNSDKSKILSAQVFLKNLSDFTVFNNIWIDWIDKSSKPSRTTIQADLIDHNWLIEISVVAAQK